MPRDEIKPRSDSADEELIRAILRLTPAERIRRMLNLQATWLTQMRLTLRQEHPELSDPALTKRMFQDIDLGFYPAPRVRLEDVL